MADKEAIVSALAQLDSSVNEHWTDDGLPRIDVIRKLTNDQSVKRQDISSAQPGFTRAGTGASEPADVQPGEISAEKEAAILAASSAENSEDVALKDLTGEISEADLKALMDKRCDEAELKLNDARNRLSEAQAYLAKCEKWQRAAIQDRGRRFPPMNAQQAVKEHLNRTAQHRLERLSPIDAYRSQMRKPGRREGNGLPVQLRPTAAA